ncbi:MAG: hypothetical protein ACOY3M_00280, partial [Patescibacteria group bacterium]
YVLVSNGKNIPLHFENRIELPERKSGRPRKGKAADNASANSNRGEQHGKGKQAQSESPHGTTATPSRSGTRSRSDSASKAVGKRNT